MMAAVAARELRDGEVVFVGIGLPNLACNLARRMHAPRLVLIYESGAVGAVPERLPVSIGDPALVTGSLMVCGMADVFQLFLQNGRIQVGLLARAPPSCACSGTCSTRRGCISGDDPGRRGGARAGAGARHRFAPHPRAAARRYVRRRLLRASPG